jgi:hypothetical protein
MGGSVQVKALSLAGVVSTFATSVNYSTNGITTDGTSLFFTGGSSTISMANISTGQITTIAGVANVYGTTDGTGMALPQ